MNKSGCRLFESVVVLWAATFFLAGCASFNFLGRRGPERISTPAAIELLSELQGINSSLSTFKGLGTISLVQKGQIQKFRAAWVAAGPDKLRIQLFGPTGQPVFSIACDGRYYYFLSPEKEGVIKQRAGAAGLKRYIEIPIGATELLSFFSGRPTYTGLKPPVAGIEKDALHGTALVLIESSGELVDTILLDGEANSIREIVRRNDEGLLLWRAEFEELKNLENYRIPQRITISTENDVSIRIEVERFWANPTLSMDLFVLSGP